MPPSRRRSSPSPSSPPRPPPTGGSGNRGKPPVSSPGPPASPSAPRKAPTSTPPTRPTSASTSSSRTANSSAPSAGRSTPNDPEEKLQVCTAASGCRRGSEGAGPGQQSNADEIAVDNDEASPSYGDLYVVDQRNFRVEKFGPKGEFLLMFGGEVDKTTPPTSAPKRTSKAATTCGAGVPGSGPGRFYQEVPGSKCAPAFALGGLSWCAPESNSIAVGPDGTVYVGDFGRIQEFEPGRDVQRRSALPCRRLRRHRSPSTRRPPLRRPRRLDERAEDHPARRRHLHAELRRAEHSAAALRRSPLSARRTNPTASCSCPRWKPSPRSAPATSYLHCRRGEAVPSTSNSSAPSPTRTAPSSSLRRLGQTREFKASPRELLQLEPLRRSPPHLRRRRPGTEPTHIALDSAGNLFVSDENGSSPSGEVGPFLNNLVFRAFDTRRHSAGRTQLRPGRAPPSAPKAKRHAPPTRQRPRCRPRRDDALRAGFNPEGWHLAVIPGPQKGPPQVSGEHASDVEPTTATLHAIVNPKGYTRPQYRFQYAPKPAGLHPLRNHHPRASPLTIREDPVARRSPASPRNRLPLPRRRRKRMRTRSPPRPICVDRRRRRRTSPPCPRSPSATSPPRPSAPNTSPSKPKLDPNNGAATHYEVCIGTEAGDLQPTASKAASPAGNEFQKREATFEHLSPNTTYHYRVSAENGFGPAETADQTLLTEETLTEEDAGPPAPTRCCAKKTTPSPCPTAAPTSRSAPPSRAAYAGQHVDFLAPSGERVAYQSGGVFAGAEPASCPSTPTSPSAPDRAGSARPPCAAPPPTSSPARSSTTAPSWTAGSSRSIPAPPSPKPKSPNRSGATTSAPPTAPSPRPPRASARLARRDTNRSPLRSSPSPRTYSRLYLGSEQPLLEEDHRPADNGPTRIYEVSRRRRPRTGDAPRRRGADRPHRGHLPESTKNSAAASPRPPPMAPSSSTTRR